MSYMVDLIKENLMAVLDIRDAAEIESDQNLMDLGMDSLLAVEISNRLKTIFGRQLSSTLAFEYPTTNALAEHILSVFFTGEDLSDEPVAGNIERRRFRKRSY